MKLKKTVLFNLYNLRKTVLIYYGILIACIIASFIILLINKDTDATFGCLEMTTVTFLFIVGLCSFRQDMYLGLQNGISRKTIFISYCISSAILAAIMALIESFFYSLLLDSKNFQTGFQQVYNGIECGNFITLVLITFGWSFTLYFAISIIGYFLAVLYYRMNKALKLIVSIGVPVSVVLLIPLFDELVANNTIKEFLIKASLAMAGIGDNTYYPGNWMISCLILAAIFAIFAYLLSRKAVVKSR